MVARWWCERVAPQVSTGNRTRATIKALPASPHHPPPTDIDEFFIRLMPITADLSAIGGCSDVRIITLNRLRCAFDDDKSAFSVI